MKKCIPDSVRKGIIDKLILIGQIDGGIGSYRNFFERVYPVAATILYQRGETLLDAIARHCDRFPGDWGDVNGMFSEVKIFDWTDEQFLNFCKEYVNPTFSRKKFDEENEEWIDLQSECVSVINLYLKDCNYELKAVGKYGDKVEYDLVELSGVKGKIQGIVFAAVGKPELLLTDVLNQDVFIPANEEKYLFYDEVIGPEGLRWGCLKNWYDNNHLPFDTSFQKRLWESVEHCDSPIEKCFFSTYLELVEEIGEEIPALIPQVYLYYDSKIQRERTIKIFDHQCMDFLMLFSGSRRVVIELDGILGHYGEKYQFPGRKFPDYIASPSLYAQMVEAQRNMTLSGYEVYRFGGKEFEDANQAKEMIKQFFKDLFEKHGLTP